MVNETVKRWFVLGGLLVITLWLVVNAPEQDETSIVAVSATRAVKPADKQQQTVFEQQDIFALTPRPTSDNERLDIFTTSRTAVKVKSKPVILPTKPIIKPSVPRLPFKYIGKLVENNVTKLFLMEGQSLHIVSQGDKVGHNYLLNKVEDTQITLLYLPLKISQTMSIGKTL